ncbi:hypothetical protein LXL04_007933 [Taraxacum kok-saghyz]
MDWDQITQLFMAYFSTVLSDPQVKRTWLGREEKIRSEGYGWEAKVLEAIKSLQSFLPSTSRIHPPNTKSNIFAAVPSFSASAIGCYRLAPKVVTVVEQDLSHAGSFLGRFVDDPNRVSFNSDVDKSRRLMTRMADVVMNKDGVGCGEAIKVTWNLINQAWCYFKRKTKLAGIEARVHGNVILEKD